LLKATPLFVKLDTNRNGSISKRELQMLSNISKQLDTSKDNKGHFWKLAKRRNKSALLLGYLIFK